LIEENLGEDGVFPADFVRAWRPEVQANVIHLGPVCIPSAEMRVPAGYSEQTAPIAHQEAVEPVA